MNNLKNIIPLFRWAQANGEATIVDRVLMKNMPEILKSKVKITQNVVDKLEVLEVDVALYEIIKKSTQDLVGSSYAGE